MKCTLTLIDKSDKIYDCFNACAALVLVDNGKKAVCGLFANAVLPFEGAPAKAVNWIDAGELSFIPGEAVRRWKMETMPQLALTFTCPKDNQKRNGENCLRCERCVDVSGEWRCAWGMEDDA